MEGAPRIRPGEVMAEDVSGAHQLALLLHRGQRHKSESIDFPPCREAENCHVESTDLGTHTKTTIPPGPPSAQIGEDARRRRQATNKELPNLWRRMRRRKRQEVSWRKEEGGKERGSFQ